MAMDGERAWRSVKENFSVGCRRLREGVENHLTVSRKIPYAAASMDDLLGSLRMRYCGQGYDCQLFGYEEESQRGCLLQVRSATSSYLGAVKTVAGLRAAVCVVCLPQGDDLLIRIFGSAWLEKVAVNVISWFVLHPLFITSVIGGWNQKSLVDKIDRDILAYFAHASDITRDTHKENRREEDGPPVLEIPENCQW